MRPEIETGFGIGTAKCRDLSKTLISLRRTNGFHLPASFGKAFRTCDFDIRKSHFAKNIKYSMMNDEIRQQLIPQTNKVQ